VLLHARALMTSGPQGATSYVEADVRDTEEILHEAARTLDFGHPVALLLLGVMGEVPDTDHPREIVTGLRRALPPGSYLVLSDATSTSPALNQAIEAYNQRSANPYRLRGPREVTRFFDGLTPISPGLVTTSRWQPGPRGTGGPHPYDAICDVGRTS
jgi:S-adenosyl methyltransferase